MTKQAYFLPTVFFAALLFICTAAFAQSQPPSHIVVTGMAEKEVVPDQIYIAITLTERYEGSHKITIDDQEQQLKTKIKDLGIDIANLSLSGADASYVKVNWLNKDVMAKKNYSLKVSNADMVGKVFQSLEDMNIKNAFISRTDYSKKEELKKELRIAAVKSAKEKATYTLEAIGQTVGKPIFIDVHENEPYNYYPRNMALAKANNSSDQGGDSDFLEFKKIKFTSNVEAKFEIK